ncbi:MAG TPA: Ig-like domain-containing protein [Clostridia bacterium]|nr:Ig-like domain-containing protein [Clostridia bacterium]
MKTNMSLTLACLLAFAPAVQSAAPIITPSLESAPPVVVKTLPVAGDETVDPATTEIRVTYSKVMQDGIWSWSTWGEENYPEITGTPRYLEDKKTCVLPVKLKPNKFYAIWLNSNNFGNFKDTGQRSAVPYLLTFKTGPGGAQ